MAAAERTRGPSIIVNRERERGSAQRDTHTKLREFYSLSHTHTHRANATLSAAPRPHAGWILIRLHELALDSILLHFALHVAENTFFLFRWALAPLFFGAPLFGSHVFCALWELSPNVPCDLRADSMNHIGGKWTSDIKSKGLQRILKYILQGIMTEIE